jgi:hypothetical protein
MSSKRVIFVAALAAALSAGQGALIEPAGAGPVPNPHSIIGRTKGAAPAYMWTEVGSMATPRVFAFSVELKDGRVLVGGGQTDSLDTIDTVEIFDPKTRAWTPTGSLIQSRSQGTSATLLEDGRVLVAGGHCYPCYLSWTKTAEIYDPATGTWSQTASMPEQLYDHIAIRLTDGRVLMTGSGGNPSSQIFDPSTDTWSQTGSLRLAVGDGRASLLRDGRVLLAGGQCANCIDVATNRVQLYDPVSGTWSDAAPMAIPRSGHAQQALEDGRVLAAGGWTPSTGAGNTVEIYDPETNRWTIGAPMLLPSWLAQSARLTSGRVIVAGGYEGTTSATQLYDPRTNAWYLAGTASDSRRNAAVGALLPDDRFLLTGGYGGSWPGTESATAEILEPLVSALDSK